MVRLFLFFVWWELCWYPILPADAQLYDFGKNKVHYSHFDWRMMQTPHFEMYFYPEEREITTIGAAIAEEHYRFLEKKFAHTITRRVPIIFYSSHLHFQQTNTIPGFLPEGVAGFTEFIKGRVVLPHNGSLTDFRHVIRHELVHVFTFDKIRAITHDYGVTSIRFPPLWFSEGLAEYWSGEWDSKGEMVIRDAVFSGDLVPIREMYRIDGSFKMYKEGEVIVRYIAEHYGEETLFLLFENWWKGETFADIFLATTGDPLEKLDRDWIYDVKKRYMPSIRESDMVSQVAEQLTSDGINVKPAAVPSPDGYHDFIFISNRTGYADIYLKGSDGHMTKLVKGGRAARFESFHPFESRLAVSRNGLMAFVAQGGKTDVLHIWDVEKRCAVTSYLLDGIISISSPAWSSDGKQIVMTGTTKSGISDLYLFTLDTGHLQPLTRDMYDDRTPTWSPDGTRIVFSSDRGAHGREGFHNLFLYALDTHTISPLTSGQHNDTSPVWSPDGARIAYSSDRNGSFNLYLLRPSPTPPGESPAFPYKVFIAPVTKILTGAFDPDWLGNDHLIFSAYEGNRFQVYSTSLPDTLSEIEEHVSSPVVSPWTMATIDQQSVQREIKYVRKLSLDIAQGQLAQDFGFGPSGGVEVILSDVLGDHQYYTLLSNNATGRSNVLTSFNVAFTRLDLTRQLNIAYGGFHVVDRFLDKFDNRFQERRVGAFTSLSYPFSRFERFETSLVVSNADRQPFYFGGQSRRTSFLVSNAIGYTKDNSLWGDVGPIDGERYNIAIGWTVDFLRSRLWVVTPNFDYRRYTRLSARSAFAMRLMGRFSFGQEPYDFAIGGSWTLRGYRWRSLWGNHFFLLNTELRFPLIDNLLIGLPVGGIGFSSVRGAIFFDAGNAWRSAFGRPVGSLGVGVRLALSYALALRFDIARKTDFRHIEPGLSRDFFFGWDF